MRRVQEEEKGRIKVLSYFGEQHGRTSNCCGFNSFHSWVTLNPKIFIHMMDYWRTS